MSRRILHLADLHLGDGHTYLGAASAARRDEADGVLRRVVDRVLSPGSGIGGVIIAGDLFDRHDPPRALVGSVIEDLDRLVRAGIRLLTVPGNHDEYSYPGGVFRAEGARWPGHLVTCPSARRVDSWVLDGQAVELYAAAYTAGRSVPPFDAFGIEPSPARKIAVLHGSLDAAWSDRSMPLRSSALAALGIDYFALGHIHRPLDRRIAQAWACYPGRIEGGGFDDPGGAGLVTIDPGADMRPVREPFPSRRIEEERWNVSGMACASELDERLSRAADPEKILRVRLQGIPGFALEPEAVVRRWSARFHALELIPPEEDPDLSRLEEIARERTIRGTFAELAASRIAEARGSGAEAAAGTGRTALLEAALRHGLAAFGPAPGEMP